MVTENCLLKIWILDVILLAIISFISFFQFIYIFLTLYYKKSESKDNRALQNEMIPSKSKIDFNAVEYRYYQHAFLDYYTEAPLIMDTHDVVSLLSD